jgi:glycosyltransferase involved in cell wall biosynthesis
VANLQTTPDSTAQDGRESAPANAPVRISLLTGGRDRPYALGLAAALVAQGVAFDYIGSDHNDSPELHQNPLVNFLNLRGDQRVDPNLRRKVLRVIKYYGRLLWYAARARPRVFHLLWNNKLEYLDRTVVLLYYRMLGKRLVHTAHNVNPRKRDGNDTWANRVTLRIQYRLMSHIFVHTPRMKQELLADFGVPDSKCTVIPFGLNSTVPNTALTPAEARSRLGLAPDEKVVLFFGYIAPYKGLEYLVEAMRLVAATMPGCRMIIAGQPKTNQAYWESISAQIDQAGLRPIVSEYIKFILDEDTEVFFKAADALMLPYTQIFQSGVLFVGYNFGLPVIASDVGSLRDDIIEGETGFVCRPQDPADLAEAIKRYFQSDLYRELPARRKMIQQFAQEKYSWTKVGEITKKVYAGLLAK